MQVGMAVEHRAQAAWSVPALFRGSARTDVDMPNHVFRVAVALVVVDDFTEE